MAIKVFGYRYTVIDDHYSEYAGEVQVGSLTIKVDSRQVQAQKESTVLHELLHAISKHLRLDLTEQQVAGLETGLYQVLTEAGADLTVLTKGMIDGGQR